MPDIVIYFNALSSRARRFARHYEAYFEAYFLSQQNAGSVVVLPSSASRHHDIGLLREACQTASECVVIGGDGSVNIVANVVVKTSVKLTVIPVGTGNDFARDHGLCNWRWRMRKPITTSKECLGVANTCYFVNHVGTGLSVDLMHLQPAWLKQSAGRLSYSIALLRYLFGSFNHRSRVHHEQHWDDGQIVALGRYIGGGIPVHPNANRGKGVMARIGIPQMQRWAQLKALLRVMQNKVEQTPALEFSTGKQFSIGDSEHPVELDGDIHFQGPVSVSVLTEAIYVTVPAGYGQRLGFERTGE
ncbi:diacylglycerol/lipid kinase family protein [Pseudidiomarina sp.]|uniref:diacylglycerol/lipid kinase family protein n=1 Tax=Pseudidiomarina sp. TaxID=2081707 RepID=UPI003A970057